MSSSTILLAACAAALLAAVAASPADTKSVATAGTSRQLADGVLSMLGVTTPEASAEDEGSVEADAAAAETKVATKTGEVAAGKAGQRGIHKKKLWIWHLWNVYSWWAWAFAVVVVKFKVALLVILGHLTYFVVALIRMLLREVPSWIQLKTVPAPYGPPPPYGPAPQYGQPQYGQQYGQQYAAAGSYSPYKRRAGTTQAAASGTDAASSSDLAYAAHAQ